MTDIGLCSALGSGNGDERQRKEGGLARKHVGRTAVIGNESRDDAECAASRRGLLVRDKLADHEEHEG